MQGESMSFMISGEAQHNVHSMNQGAKIMDDFDLNTSPIINCDEQSLEDCFENHQQKSISHIQHTPLFFTNWSSSREAQQKAHCNNQDVMHNFDLNEMPPFNNDDQSLLEERHEKAQDKGQDASPLTNNDEQPFEVYYERQSSKRHILQTIPCEIMDESIIVEESKATTTISLFGEAQEKTQPNKQVMLDFDLNVVPSSNSDAQLFEDLTCYVQRYPKSLAVSHMGSHEVMRETSSACGLQNIFLATLPPFNLPCSSQSKMG